MSTELKGICKDCLGCNRIEDENFEGVEECKYATVKQLKIEGE